MLSFNLIVQYLIMLLNVALPNHYFMLTILNQYTHYIMAT